MEATLQIALQAGIGLSEAVERLLTSNTLRLEEAELVLDLRRRLTRLRDLTKGLKIDVALSYSQDVSESLIALTNFLAKRSKGNFVKEMLRLSMRLDTCLTDLALSIQKYKAPEATEHLTAGLPASKLSKHIQVELTFPDSAEFYEKHFLHKGVAIEFPIFMSCLEFHLYSEKRPFIKEFRIWAEWLLEPNVDGFIKFSELNSFMIVIYYAQSLNYQNGHLSFDLNITQDEKYIGQLLDGARHGYGVCLKQDRTVVTGTWDKNIQHSETVVYCPSGMQIKGYCIDNRLDRKVQMTWPDGSSYTGDLEDRLRHGKGTFTWPDGSSYKGGWVGDNEDGYGELRAPDGSIIFEGIWVGGLKHGAGTSYLENGLIMKCDYQNGEAILPGEYEKPNEWTFTGTIVDGQRVGEGHCKWANGCEYKGSWLSDKRHGIGEYTSGDSLVTYFGNWSDDQRYGSGQIETEREIIIGSFNGDTMVGEGTRYSKGDRPKGKRLQDGKEGSSCCTF